MIRCVRLWTGEDGNSHFRDGSSPALTNRGNTTAANVPSVAV